MQKELNKSINSLPSEVYICCNTQGQNENECKNSSVDVQYQAIVDGKKSESFITLNKNSKFLDLINNSQATISQQFTVTLIERNNKFFLKKTGTWRDGNSYIVDEPAEKSNINLGQYYQLFHNYKPNKEAGIIINNNIVYHIIDIKIIRPNKLLYIQSKDGKNNCSYDLKQTDLTFDDPNQKRYSCINPKIINPNDSSIVGEINSSSEVFNEDTQIIINELSEENRSVFIFEDETNIGQASKLVRVISEKKSDPYFTTTTFVKNLAWFSLIAIFLTAVAYQYKMLPNWFIQN